MILNLSIILILFLTGGAHIQHPKIKLEVSQIDTFAWIFFVLALIRKKTSGYFFPNQIERLFESLMHIFEKNSTRILQIACLFFSLVFFWIIAWRYQSFNANAYDLSYINQPIWNTTKGFFLHSSLAVNRTYLGEHFAPIIALLSPLYWIVDSIYLLFLFTVILSVFSVFLLQKLCQEFQLSRTLTTLVCICFLLYQPLRSALLFDFREDHFFIPIFISILLFLKQGKYRHVWPLSLLLLLVKENASIFLALIATLGLLEQKFYRKRALNTKVIHLILLILLSSAAFYIINTKLTPYFSGNANKTRFAFRMGAFGTTTTEFSQYILHNPLSFFQYLVSTLFNKASFKYFAIVFTPFLICIKYSPFPILIALIGFILNLIVGLRFGFHYECVLIPFLFYALIETFSRIQKINSSTFGLILLGFFLFFGRSPIYYLQEFIPTEHDRMVENEIRQVPKSASVATTTALHPHFSLRKDAFLFSGEPTAEYVVADTHPTRNLYGTPNLESDIARMSQLNYDLVVDQDDFKIWKKK